MPKNKAPRFTDNELEVFEGISQGEIIAIGDDFVTDKGDTLTFSLAGGDIGLFSVSEDGVVTYEGDTPLDFETGATSLTYINPENKS